MNDNQLLAFTEVRQGMPMVAYQEAEYRAAMKMGLALLNHMLESKGVVAYKGRAEWVPYRGDNSYMPVDRYQIRATILAVMREDTYHVVLGGNFDNTPMPPLEVLRLVPDPKPYNVPVPTPAKLQDMRAGLLIKELWRQFRAFMDRQEACSYVRPQSSYPDEYWFTNWRS